MNSILKNFACLFLGAAFSCYAVDGFSVAAADGNFSANLYGGFGHIVRVEINNSQPGESKELTSTKGRFARISQDGKQVAFIAENKDIIVMSACDGSDAKKVGTAETNHGYLAWVNNNTIYFSGAGYNEAGSKKIFSVPADGSAGAQQIVTFNVTMWVWGISEDGTRATVRPCDGQQGTCGGGTMGEVYKCTLPGNVTLTCGQNVIDNQGCGNAISPAGEYISYFDAVDHSIIAFKTWSGSGAGSIDTRTMYTTTSRNNRTRWSSNSEDWICLYHSNNRQVLLNRATKECIKVNESGSRMPGDFWVGTPPSCDGTRARGACRSCAKGIDTRLTITQDAAGNMTAYMPGASGTIEIVDLQGQRIASQQIIGGAAHFRPLARGAYLARVNAGNANRIAVSFVVD